MGLRIATGNHGPEGSWAQGEGTGSDMTGTGSDVFLNGKPLTSRKNGSWAQEEVKPLRKRGLKVQSPIGAAGVGIKG